ncbi:MAG: hypothetical protein DRQ35_02480 [Gammaproteobacteria bacterium]|nr:MAG: hypothetical protein DRQ35_02480 [Gammaproteobacteria bacterium]
MNSDHSETTDFLSIVVRLLGLLMLIIGLYVGIKVIFEAWNLYDEPQRIERFADAIEQGSHLDSLLSSFTEKETSNDANDVQAWQPKHERQKESIRVTYFLAWFIAIILLMVVGSLASSAIKTGGQLALYDLQVKRFANLLMEEVRNKTKEE